MQVMAFAAPDRADWRWRIVNYSGGIVEESGATFDTIRGAVSGGTRRLHELSAADLAAGTDRDALASGHPELPTGGRGAV
jgi:hypothetical protein